MVSELCASPVGADTSENQAMGCPVSLETQAVRVTEKVKGCDIEMNQGGCQVQILILQMKYSAQRGQVTCERSLSQMVADWEQTASLFSP